MNTLGAIWRFATDECPGGVKTTAVCIKLCMFVLAGVVISSMYYGPTIVQKVLAITSAVEDLTAVKNQLIALPQSIALQNAIDSARKAEVDRKFEIVDRRGTSQRADINLSQRDIVSLQGDMRRAQTDIRQNRDDIKRLDATTIKSGRSK